MRRIIYHMYSDRHARVTNSINPDDMPYLPNVFRQAWANSVDPDETHYLPYVFRQTGLSKQCRPRWDTLFTICIQTGLYCLLRPVCPNTYGKNKEVHFTVCWCVLTLQKPDMFLPLQTMQIQISWPLKKPTDLDLHCLPLSMWIYINNLDKVIWLAEN